MKENIVTIVLGVNEPKLALGINKANGAQTLSSDPKLLGLGLIVGIGLVLRHAKDSKRLTADHRLVGQRLAALSFHRHFDQADKARI